MLKQTRLLTSLQKEFDSQTQPSIQPRLPGKKTSVLEIIGTATRGGMENQIVNFLRKLPAAEFSITCICPCESLFTKQLRQLGVEAVYVTPLADNPEWRSVQMAMEVACLHQVDVLHAHMPKSHVLAAVAGSLLQKPVVATVHGMHVTAHELGVALAAKSHLITNCQETYIQALALGVPPERVNLFHNGVDTKLFQPGGQGKKFRAHINVPDDAILVGFVGRLEPEKGPDLFVRAAGVIHHLLPQVHFAVVGDGSMLKKLKKLSKQLGIGDHIHFADWSSDTAEVYPAFDIMAHTSRSDGTSLVLLEAMACGVPVVGMAVGGVREMIENEHTGMQVPANDWEALGQQITQLLEQPKLVKAMGAAARKRVEENFNAVDTAKKTAALLKYAATSAEDKLNSGEQAAVNGNGALKIAAQASHQNNFE
jgi:glycosyltransferase involved in cell wall biosynthesis